MDYVTDYARKVYKGDIIASEKNIQVAKRHLKDLKRKDFDYHFDVDRSNEVIKFIEMLPDPKSGEKLKLASFQKFIVGSLYGWVDELGNRRYTKSYISKARKNGKTLIVTGIGGYELLLGDEPKNERLVGLTANSREQAGIAYDMAKAQFESLRSVSGTIKDMTKIRESTKEVINLRDNSKIKAVSNDASNLEGFQFSFAVIDEFHEAKDRKMYETLRRGQMLLNNPALHVISTAGFNLTSPMFEEYQYITGLLDGLYENDNYFVYCAEQDSEDEVYDQKTWIKSNPLMEIPAVEKVMKKNIQEDVDEAIEKNDLNGILVKNFNMWRQATKETYISYPDWKGAYTDKPFDCTGRDVFIGLDMSRRDDLTAIGFVYPLDDGQYFVDAHTFIGHKGGIRAKSERDKIDYERLIQTDYATLTNTTSGIINDKQVFDWLIGYIEENSLNVQSINYDPWSMANMIVYFEDYSYPLIEVRQNYMNLSEPLKEFKLDVFEQNIFHKNNPNLNLSIGHAITKTDNNGNILLDKKKNREKIDPLVSVINAYSQAIHYDHNKNLEKWILSDDFGF